MGRPPGAPPARQHGGIARRLLWLVTCLAAGVGVGVIGSLFFGSPYGYLAVPLALALGWIFVADPTQCSPPPPARPGADARREPGP